MGSNHDKNRCQKSRDTLPLLLREKKIQKNRNGQQFNLKILLRIRKKQTMQCTVEKGKGIKRFKSGHFLFLPY